VIIMLSAFAAYKCKSVRRFCGRRRNSRGRRNKKSRTYYYLNKQSADNAEDIADPLLQQEEVQMQMKVSKPKRSGKKSRGHRPPS